MAYFSSGSDGMDFMAQWCDQCRHFRERENDPMKCNGPGCPIWDAHLLSDMNNEETRKALDALIYESKDGERFCRMFEHESARRDDNHEELDRLLGFAIGQDVLPHERIERVRKLIEGA